MIVVQAQINMPDNNNPAKMSSGLANCDSISVIKIKYELYFTK